MFRKKFRQTIFTNFKNCKNKRTFAFNFGLPKIEHMNTKFPVTLRLIAYERLSSEGRIFSKTYNK